MVGLSSCKVVFTESVRTKVELQGIELNKIQYYNSKNFLLTRTLSKSEASLSSGKIKIKNGEYVEIIKIKSKTPGVCDSIGDNILLIRFESGSNKYLKFKNGNILDPSSSYGITSDEIKKEKKKIETTDKYGEKRIAEKEFQTNYVNYDNKIYQLEYESKPELMIKRKRINNKEIDKRTAKGVKIK